MNWESIKTAILNTGIKVVVALIILIVAFNIINVIFKKLKEKSDKSGKIDPMLTKALINAGRWLAKILVIIALVGYLGIDTTGFSALIASLGVALGLAAFCGAQRTPMRFRADAMRSITGAPKRWILLFSSSAGSLLYSASLPV